MTHIMIIDDSPTVRKILEVALSRADFTVALFADGVEAMREMVNGRTPVPDVMIVDIALPKADGYEVTMRFKARPELAQTDVIILTRRDGIIDKLKGRLAGAKVWLCKPFKTAEVIQTIQSLLAARQTPP